MHCKYSLHASATISTDFFFQWWGSCFICIALIIVCLLLDQPAGSFLTAGDGIISTWMGYSWGVVYIKSLFPIRRETPTMCFSTSVTIFTIPCLKTVCSMFYFSFQICVGHSCCISAVSEDLWVDTQILGLWLCLSQKDCLLCAHWLPCRVSSPF